MSRNKQSLSFLKFKLTLQTFISNLVAVLSLVIAAHLLLGLIYLLICTLCIYYLYVWGGFQVLGVKSRAQCMLNTSSHHRASSPARHAPMRTLNRETTLTQMSVTSN